MRFSSPPNGQEGGFSRWLVVVALVFLALALVVALWVAPNLQSRGTGPFAAVFLGSALVVYAAWFVAYAACRVVKYIRRR